MEGGSLREECRSRGHCRNCGGDLNEFARPYRHGTEGVARFSTAAGPRRTLSDAEINVPTVFLKCSPGAGIFRRFRELKPLDPLEQQPVS